MNRMRSLARHEISQALDDEAVGLLGADGHAQRMRQAVIVESAQHEAALREEHIRLRRGFLYLVAVIGGVLLLGVVCVYGVTLLFR